MKDSSLIAEVVVPGVPPLLTYSIPKSLSSVEVGASVTVEVGRRTAKGWLVAKKSLKQDEIENLFRPSAKEKPSNQLSLDIGASRNAKSGKSLKELIEAHPGFSPDQIDLFRWMAEYYGAPLSEVIETAVPKRQIIKDSVVLTITDAGRECIASQDELDALVKRAPVQAAILKVLDSSGGEEPLVAVKQIIPGADSAARALQKKKLIDKKKVAVDPTSYLQQSHTVNEALHRFQLKAPTELIPAQKKALADIEKSLNTKEFSPLLLFGVTGSGKTEVYIRAIEKVIEEGGSALVIVPEISLTPQLFDHFHARLGIPLALLHSQVGLTARWYAWESVRNGSVKVAIGARSAIFAPMQDLRLIIVDEEHESSYKQSDGFRYHGRDIAVMRAKFAKTTIILGSATPSFESLLNVQKSRYQLLEMPARVTSRPLPEIEIVDLGAIKRKEMPSENLSPQLHQAIEETLGRGGQVIIFYNRRGFSSYLQCESCGEVVNCPSCSVSMTYHKKKDALLCHLCDMSMVPPGYCSICRDDRTTRPETDIEGVQILSNSKQEKIGLLVHRGGGTERVVDELELLFPDATIVRMDRDTITKKTAYRTILGSMRSGKADILVGTQMIAKGHDLPGVTLVGIIDADVGLHMPDFRASERTFQLITQAAGRAGRGKEQGRVLVQTREPDHPTIVATATNRFKAFARYELEYRKALGYPPWGRLLRAIISAESQKLTVRAAIETSAFLQSIIDTQAAKGSKSWGEVTILGPAPAAYERLRGRYRFHILVKATSAPVISMLAAELSTWKTNIRKQADVRVAIDVDPVEML